MLSDLPVSRDKRVLVDYRTADDAGVYRWDGGSALVQTVDFFTPIVDDPFVYGQIAAANSVSDVFAMGGTPMTALAVAAFPPEFDPAAVRAIFEGGLSKLREAGAALLGGHTVRDSEIKFGYAVTGAVDPERVLTNAGAQRGDVLLLTKPLGTGIVATAIKFQRAPQTTTDAAIASMTELNASAASVLRAAPAGAVHACTDVTGFGLIGHSSEIAAASGVSLAIDIGHVPLLPGVLDLVKRNKTGGGESNRQYFAVRLEAPNGVRQEVLAVLYDPQTSGGLLIAVDPSFQQELADRLRAAGVTAARIGDVKERQDAAVILTA